MSLKFIIMSKRNKTKIVIFRHGESFGNAQKIIQGINTDLELTDTGYGQALELRNTLEKQNINPEFYLAPQTQRHLETTNILSYQGSNTVDIMEELAECSFGILDGHPVLEYLEKYTDVRQAWSNPSHPNFWDVKIEGGESRRDLQIRAKNVIRQIKSIKKYHKLIGLCSSEMFMQSLALELTGGYYAGFKPCEYFVVDI